MSWQTYVDEHLMCDIEGNQLSSAAIIGHDGTVWAQSASFPQVPQFQFQFQLHSILLSHYHLVYLYILMHVNVLVVFELIIIKL